MPRAAHTTANEKRIMSTTSRPDRLSKARSSGQRRVIAVLLLLVAFAAVPLRADARWSPVTDAASGVTVRAVWVNGKPITQTHNDVYGKQSNLKAMAVTQSNPGATLTVRMHLVHPSGIVAPDLSGYNSHYGTSMEGHFSRLQLVEGSPTDGVWEGTWTVGAFVAVSSFRFNEWLFSLATGPDTARSYTRYVLAVDAFPKRSGYWLVERDGTIYAFGDAEKYPPVGKPVIDAATDPGGHGLWVLAADGDVIVYGEAEDQGSASLKALAKGEHLATIAAHPGQTRKLITPGESGYWVFTDRGRVFPFGDAGYFGDLTTVALNGPIVASQSTPSGRGYQMIGSDGGVFSFGDGAFHGSMGDARLNRPVNGIAPDPDGDGYWLVASDGGVFGFDAGFAGSMGGKPLNAPIVEMVPYGDGYLMLGSDGGVFNFSSLDFSGSLGSTPPDTPIVSVVGFSQ
jgi:hypothetical protein